MRMVKLLTHSTKKCGGIYETLYTEDETPYLKCDKCAHELKDWVKWESEYKDYWNSPDKWNEKKNHITCLLGFFAEKYRNEYEFEYSWSLNEKGLFRGPEANILRRIYKTFNMDPLIVRKYIEWYFDFKVRRRKKKITSLSFLAVSALMNEFKIFHKKARTITRDRKLPEGMCRWIKDFAPVVEEFNMHDYGDLKHMLTLFTSGQIKDEQINKFVNILGRQGVIDEKHQIQNWREG